MEREVRIVKTLCPRQEESENIFYVEKKMENIFSLKKNERNYSNERCVCGVTFLLYWRLQLQSEHWLLRCRHAFVRASCLCHIGSVDNRNSLWRELTPPCHARVCVVLWSPSMSWSTETDTDARHCHQPTLSPAIAGSWFAAMETVIKTLDTSLVTLVCLHGRV